MTQNPQDSEFVNIELELLLAGEPLPGDLFLKIDNRYIKYRNAGDLIDRQTWDRLEFKMVTYIYVRTRDNDSFTQWAMKKAMLEQESTGMPAEMRAARGELQRKTLEVFTSEQPAGKITPAYNSSRKMVGDLLKQPHARRSMAHLASLARGTVDHSVNVSVLSSYLAMQMGYTHQGILQNIAIGGLLHDIGKKKIELEESDPPELAELKMRDHPVFGLQILANNPEITPEIKQIISQHHEFHDGTGYPQRLRGKQIYDLARIVSIANVYDDLVQKAPGKSLAEKQRMAVNALEKNFVKKYDPEKFEKAIKILRAGV